MWHGLLSRQLRKAGLVDADQPPDAETWRRLLEHVSLTYSQADDDRYTLERSLEVAAAEMAELYDSLRVQSETDLARERDRLRSVVTSVGDGLCVLDASGALLFANPPACRLLGWANDPPLGEPLFDQLLLHTVERSGPLGLDDLSSLEPVRCEQAWLQAGGGGEGAPLPVSFVLNPMTEGAALSGAVLVFRDMTESRRLQLQLRQAVETAELASESKSRFLATMSHEIRTPMNGVTGMLSLLLGTPLNPQQRDFAETAHNSGQALLTLINDILDFSKIEAGKLELEQIPCELGALAEDVADLLAERAHGKGLELVVELERGLPASVLADPVRLRQVLVNLVGNAIKFTDSGRIAIRMRSLGRRGDLERLQVSVADTGTGIAEQAREKLFEAFTQADSSTTRRFGGTGLGLAICKSLVERMGGTISVESALGEGSCFSFTATLPRDPALLDEPAPQPLRGVRVLVVEPLEATRLVLGAQLEALGISVLSTAAADAGRAELRRCVESGESVDVLLLDRHEAGGPAGPGLVHALAADPALARLPILLLSDWCDLRGDDEPEVAAVLTKPVRRASLRSALHTVLGRSQPARQQLVPGPAPASAIAPARLLLVEDNLTNQRVAQHMLQRLGHQVTIANDGHEALRLLDRLAVDLILMDCQMPVLDGFETTRILRSQGPPWERIPIVAMTANALQGDRERCLAAGMDDYITKPVSLEALGAALARHLGEDSRARALRPS